MKLTTRINILTGEKISVTHPGITLEGKNKYKRLYHYTSFDHFLEIFKSQQLKFGQFINMNDIMEANRRMVCDTPKQIPLLFAMRDILASYKQICFTMDYDSLIKGCMSNSMWYHYGDKRNGVCIEFDADKLPLTSDFLCGEVDYHYLLDAKLSLPKEALSVVDVETFINKHKHQIFFTKTKEWQYENEYRIVCQNENNLDVSEAITAIYFTDCDNALVMAAEKIVGDSIQIKYIDYINESGDITPLDQGTANMRQKMRRIMESQKNETSLMQQAEKLYETNKHKRDCPLLLTDYDN